MNHNWSARKQRLHLQDRIRRCGTSSESRRNLQGHRSVSVNCHFLLQAPQCPCSVQKQFSRDHCCRGRSKPGCQIVGSHTRWELTTWTDFQLCFRRLLMSTGCKSSHSGFLDVSRSNGGLKISGWTGQLSCLTIFSTSLSVAFLFRRAGGSMILMKLKHILNAVITALVTSALPCSLLHVKWSTGVYNISVI